ncbi:MAG TPA: hypothetical protein VFW53_01000 [Gallionella sp.]|nr:hypothetical protein [Gallionella sp.]
MRNRARRYWIGHAELALGALSLFLMNLICVNLAGVTTFMVQGIRPATWWEKDRAVKATRIAIALWAILLAALTGMILIEMAEGAGAKTHVQGKPHSATELAAWQEQKERLV